MTLLRNKNAFLRKILVFHNIYVFLKFTYLIQNVVRSLNPKKKRGGAVLVFEKFVYISLKSLIR